MRRLPPTPLTARPLRAARLGNGLRVLVLPDGSVPIVATAMVYRVGSGGEEPGESGVSHLLEHMMFKGTRSMEKGEIDRRTQRAGGRNNAFTSHDLTVYQFEFAAPRLEVALGIEADRMRNCVFDPGEFEAERQVVVEELKRDLDDPWGRLFREVEAALFVRHPYRNPIIGWPDELEGLSRDALFRHYRSAYSPANATLVVAGDVRPGETLAAARRLFGRIPRDRDPRGVPVRRPPPPRAEPGGEKRVLLRQEIESERLLLAQLGRPLAAPDGAAVDVLKAILGTGFSSRLHRRLVERDRIATHVDAFHEARRDAGVLFVQAEAQEGRDADSLAAAVADEMRALRERLVPEREVEKGRSLAFADFVFAQDTALERAIVAGTWDALASLERLADYPRRLARVSASDVREAARAILGEERRVTGLSRPARGAARLAPAGRAPSAARSRAWRTRPAERALPAMAPLPVRRETLANGLRVLFLERRGLPDAAISLVVEGARLAEPESKAGLAAVCGDLLDAGTRRYSAAEIAERIESRGGEMQTGPDGIRARSLAADFDLALGLVAECALRPVFPAGELAKTKERLVSEIRAERDDALTIAQRVFDEIVFRGHPFHRPPRGYERTLAKLRRKDCVAHHARVFVPGNAVLAIAGRLDPRAAMRSVRLAFGGWRGGAKKAVAPPPRDPGRRARRFVPLGREQVQILAGHGGIRRTDPDWHALLVLDVLFGAGPGFTDRLTHRIRDELGLAYSVSGAITPSSGAEPGRFLVHVGTSPENGERALRVVFDEIRRLTQEPPTEAEVAGAVDYLTGSLVFGFETAEQLTLRLVEMERFSLGADYPSRFPRIVRSIRPADVLAAARRHVRPDRCALVVVGPKSAAPMIRSRNQGGAPTS